MHKAMVEDVSMAHSYKGFALNGSTGIGPSNGSAANYYERFMLVQTCAPLNTWGSSAANIFLKIAMIHLPKPLAMLVLFLTPEVCLDVYS